MRQNFHKLAVLLSIWLVFNCNANASQCPSGLLNPFTDIAYNCIFPISIGGILHIGGGEKDHRESSKSPICACKGVVPKIGLRISFWEPSNIIDSVSEPYCIMPLGKKIASARMDSLKGSLDNTKAFQQIHYYIFPLWPMLNMFTDIPCFDHKGFDAAFLSELYPAWQDETKGILFNPEAILFGNPLTYGACMADATASVKRPVNSLFWCMGSWGMTYPLSGSIVSTDYTEANIALAARGIFLMGRLGMLRHSSDDGCSSILAPIWKKDRFRLQIMHPTNDRACLNIGRSGWLWQSSSKHKIDDDNFSFMVFKHQDCCVSPY